MNEPMPYTHDPMACRIIYKQDMARWLAGNGKQPKPCPYGCNERRE